MRNFGGFLEAEDVVPKIKHLSPEELDSPWGVKKIIMDFPSIPQSQDIGGANFDENLSTGFNLLGAIVWQILRDVSAICQKGSGQNTCGCHPMQGRLLDRTEAKRQERAICHN